MKRATREQLEADNLRLSHENTMTHRALIAVLNHETELPVSFFAKDVVPDKPGRYTFRFFDWDSPDCEKVIVTYALAGQKDYLSVYDLDQQRGWIHNNPGTVWAKIVYHALANRKRRTVAA